MDYLDVRVQPVNQAEVISARRIPLDSVWPPVPSVRIKGHHRDTRNLLQRQSHLRLRLSPPHPWTPAGTVLRTEGTLGRPTSQQPKRVPWRNPPSETANGPKYHHFRFLTMRLLYPPSPLRRLELSGGSTPDQLRPLRRHRLV